MLTPPTAEAEPLVLEVTSAVEEVKPDTAMGMVPAVEPGRQLEIGGQAKTFAKDAVSVNPHSPEFAERLKDIQSLAQAEIVKAGSGAASILERSSTSVAGSKKNGGDATQQVAGTLSELRATVQDLTPNAAELSGTQKIMGFIPGGKKIRRYFQKYESAQTQLDGIVKNLMAGQDVLMKDNAALENEKRDLWTAMGEIQEFIVFAEKLDEELANEVQALKARGEVEAANTVETDLLFTVRQRRQDLMTQLAVSVQGYMAMDLIIKNNRELIKGVDRARTTTIFALRTAVAVAAALDNQKLVLDQIDAINTTTNNMIEQTSIMLRQQTGQIQQQAVNSGVAVESLTKAFDNIFATMDEIDTFKLQANAQMETTINSLSTQLERAKPQLERMRANEGQDGPPALNR